MTKAFHPKKRIGKIGGSSKSWCISSTIMDKVCIFCPPAKTCKYIKRSRTREPLTKCVQLGADSTVRDIALKNKTVESWQS